MKLEIEVPKQVTANKEIAAAVKQGISAVGAVMLVASILTASGTMFIAFIGFSEILAFLPMVNLDYTGNLKVFF